MPTFKEQHREFQELVRELMFVRNHNLAIKPGDPQDKLLMFAEAALVLTAMERFLRMIVADATDADSLYTLLQKATSRDRDLIRFAADTDRDDAIRRITDVRNTMLHGNYEQAARNAKRADVATYFREQFTPEVEKLYQLVDGMVAQIDPDTGRRKT
jgi:hypothetical protein